MLDSTKERETEFDLVWYWCHSEADCGIKSNYMSMINVACYGASTTFHDPYNSFILKSVDHRHNIEEILYVLPYKLQKILYLTFADIKLFTQIEIIFNKYTGAAHLNSFLIASDLNKLCRNFHVGKTTDKEKALISQIRIESMNNYHEAVDAYIKAKRKYFKTIRRKHEIKK
jgi:hypothetical protein